MTGNRELRSLIKQQRKLDSQDKATSGPSARETRAARRGNAQITPTSAPVTAANANRIGTMLETLDKLRRDASRALGDFKQAEPRAVHDLRESEDKNWAFFDETNVSNFERRIPNPALDFPFELDPFQKRAILHVHNENDVFVAAHTSAGKTVVAEYAIALAERTGRRVIYTAPIKTISNQKYNDFCDKFKDVGLITGDQTINPNAKVLIMTTEILRAMIYNADDRLTSVAYIVFDEVQYLNDKERGVVWEECIVLLPLQIRMIMLSATVPNALEFSSWVGRTKGRRVAVISTTTRPVPLQHSVLNFCKLGDMQEDVIIPAGGKYEGLPCHSDLAGMPDMRFGLELDHRMKMELQLENIPDLAQYLEDQERTPAIVFLFSRKKCGVAHDLSYQIDLLPEENNKQAVQEILDKAVERLDENDGNLVELLKFQNSLLRGIACHHAGLLPKVKTVIEELFSKGLVKVLYATETFAVGVNLPARAVVFSDLSKFDGKTTRILEPGEYAQMAGRAGRRGIDKIGHVFMFKNTAVKFPGPDELESIVSGQPPPLQSKFRLSYGMILKCLRRKNIDVFNIMKNSFREAGNDSRVKYAFDLEKQIESNLNDIAEELKTSFAIPSDHEMLRGDMVGADEEDPPEPDALVDAVAKYLKDFTILKDTHIIANRRKLYGILQIEATPGRLVVAEVEVGHLALSTVYSVIYNGRGSRNAGPTTPVWLASVTGILPSAEKDYCSSVLLMPECRRDKDLQNVKDGDVYVVTSNGLVVTLKQVQRSKILYVCEKKEEISIEEREFRRKAASTLHFDSRRNKDLQPTLKRTADYLQTVVSEWQTRPDASTNYQYIPFPEMSDRLQYLYGKGHAKEFQNFFNDSVLAQRVGAACGKDVFKNLGMRLMLEETPRFIKRLRVHAEKLSLPALLQSYEARLKVLKSLGYLESDDKKITAKGRAACNVESADAIVITEFVTRGYDKGLNSAEVASLLSCFVCYNRINTSNELELVLSAKWQRALKAVDTMLGEVDDLYRHSFGSYSYTGADYTILERGLTKVVHEIVKGTPLSRIVRMAREEESLGDIVVCLKRVIELLNQVKKVSKAHGAGKLTRKLERASIILRKDPILKDLVSSEDEEPKLDIPPEVSDDEEELDLPDDERDWSRDMPSRFNALDIDGGW